MKRLLILLALVGLGASACGTAPETPAFSSVDLIVGAGATATAGHPVTVKYTGWLYDSKKTDNKGTQFDSSNAFTFVLGNGAVIAGWDQGVPGMKVGGKRRLIIPANLAYGSKGSGPIPGDTAIVFDIDLIAVQ